MPLEGALIAAACGGAADVETVARTGSTNSDLLVRARAAAPVRPLLCAALEQTEGRGRHGRPWVATPGAALLFSMAVPLAAPRGVDAAVSLACGLAAAEALAPLAEMQLKWPNDLLLRGRKVGGVLCELALDGEGQRTLVAGIGINLWLDPATCAAIGQPAAALADVVPGERLATQREALIGRVAKSVLALIGEFDASGFAPLRPRFLARFALLGREVQLADAHLPVAGGVATDIDEAGRLLLLTRSGTRAFAGGEVSLRPAAGA